MDESTTLTDLAKKYKTDKASHGYLPYYEKHLPAAPKRILEIGCLTGASLRMWREYFPDTEIHCLDLFEEHQPPEDIPGVIYWKGNQTDQYVLEQLRRLHFDVVIEDGSHALVHQWVTFHSLIGCCDLYVVEDLHCANDASYREGFGFKHSMLSKLQNPAFDAFPYRYQLYDDKIAFIYAD